MEDFLRHWSYLGVFVAILATGLGLPMPEELPIVLAGSLARNQEVYAWMMLPVCIVGVVIGDSFLYFIGRFWGIKLVQSPFVKKHLLPPDRLASITENFQKYGIKILLFARLTPGIRAPIFLTAGITRLPLAKFLLADGLYAIPGVSLLFFLGFWFTDSMVGLIHDADYAKSIIVMVVLVAVAGYLTYLFLRKPMVTGTPEEMPPVVGSVTTTLDNVAHNVAHNVAEKIRGGHPEGPPAVPPPTSNGQHAPAAERPRDAERPA